MTKSKQSGMTDAQIEEFIFGKIKKKDVTFYDMIGGRRIDPDPCNKDTDSRNRVRTNRFSSLSESDRMVEIFADMDCSYLDHFPPLRISLQDLFRFWWNRCVDQGLVVEMILEDIFIFIREEMRPPVEEPEQLNMAVDFEQLSLPMAEVKKAA